MKCGKISTNVCESMNFVGSFALRASNPTDAWCIALHCVGARESFIVCHASRSVATTTKLSAHCISSSFLLLVLLILHLHALGRCMSAPSIIQYQESINKSVNMPPKKNFSRENTINRSCSGDLMRHPIPHYLCCVHFMLFTSTFPFSSPESKFEDFGELNGLFLRARSIERPQRSIDARSCGILYLSIRNNCVR